MEIDLRPLSKKAELALRKLRNIEVPEFKLPIFKTDEQIEIEKRLEELKRDYNFYSKCLRVLSKKRNKEKLIRNIKGRMYTIEWEYSDKGVMYELSKM